MKRLRTFGSWLVTGVLSFVTVAGVIALFQSPRTLESAPNLRPPVISTTVEARTTRVVVTPIARSRSIHVAAQIVDTAATTTSTFERVTPTTPTTSATTTTTWLPVTTTTIHHDRGGGDDGGGNDGGGDDGGTDD
jgi:hypothetical protein